MPHRDSSAETVVENVFRRQENDASRQENASSSSSSSSSTPEIEANKKKNNRYDVRKWSKTRALTTMRISNCCNGCCLITAAIAAFLLPTGALVPSFDSITLSVYVILLGLLMVCAECNLSLLQHKLRNNFGFLFTYFGRALFLLFTGTVAVALGNKTNFFMWIVGGITGLNAIFNGIIIFVHPAFVSGEIQKYADPSKESSTAESEVMAYVAAHPEMAAQALTGGFAAANAVGGPGAGVGLMGGAAAVALASGGGGGGAGAGAAAAANSGSVGNSFMPNLAALALSNRGARVAMAAKGTPSGAAVPSQHTASTAATATTAKDVKLNISASEYDHSPHHKPVVVIGGSGADANPFSGTSLANMAIPTLAPARPLGTSSSSAVGGGSSGSSGAAANPFGSTGIGYAATNTTTSPPTAIGRPVAGSGSRINSLGISTFANGKQGVGGVVVSHNNPYAAAVAMSSSSSGGGPPLEEEEENAFL